MQRLSLLALFGALLIIAATTRAAPASPPPPPIELAGRNCGGTSKGAGFAGALAQLPASGWNNAAPVSSSPGAINQIAPAAAIDPSGRPLIVWQESTARDGGDIVALPSNALAPVRVDDTGTQPALQSRPTLAIDGNGRVHVAWEDLRSPGATQIYYAFSDNGGATWSENSNLTSGRASRDHLEPQLFATTDGSLILAWRSNRSGTPGVSDILAMRFNGANWSEPVRLNSEQAVGERRLPRLAADGQGGVLAVWEDRRFVTPGIYSARLNDVAGVWSAETLVSPLRTFAIRPSITTAPDGTLYLAYQGNPGIFVQASADNGATWSVPQRTDDGNGSTFTDPQIVVDEFGGVHCIWCQLQGDASIIAARSADGGATWGDRVPLAATTGTTDPLGLVTDERGRVYAFWADDRDNPLQRRLYSATWQAEALYLPLITR